MCLKSKNNVKVIKIGDVNGNLKMLNPFSSNIYNWAIAQVWAESKICKAFPCFQYSHLGQCPKYVPGANSLFPCANIKFLNLEEKLLKMKPKLSCASYVFQIIIPVETLCTKCLKMM